MKDIAREFVKGLLAGPVGTAAMTLSEAAEMRLTGRGEHRFGSRRGETLRRAANGGRGDGPLE